MCLRGGLWPLFDRHDLPLVVELGVTTAEGGQQRAEVAAHLHTYLVDVQAEARQRTAGS